MFNRWQNSYASRNRLFKGMMIGGVLVVIASVGTMLALVCGGIANQMIPIACGSFMMLGFMLIVVGAMYALINVRPILPSLVIQEDTVSVKGCGEKFLASLPE